MGQGVFRPYLAALALVTARKMAPAPGSSTRAASAEPVSPLSCSVAGGCSRRHARRDVVPDEVSLQVTRMYAKGVRFEFPFGCLERLLRRSFLAQPGRQEDHLTVI